MWFNFFKKDPARKKDCQKLTTYANKHGVKGRVSWTQPYHSFEGRFHLRHPYRDDPNDTVLTDMGATPSEVKTRIRQWLK